MKILPDSLPRFNNIHFIAVLISLFVCTQSIHAQEQHPHILVKQQDKSVILEKINNQAWAKKIFDDLQESVRPYAERHVTDTAWILSRYLMNRAPGKRYTKFYSDEDGTMLVKYEGDAPYPTVRVSSHKRQPITNDGYNYKMPSIEELVPYDTSMKMQLQRNAPDGKKEWVNPQSFIEGINGKINKLALNAAIVYWLTGKEMYAKFAADILSQWARGAFYQNPIEGPCRTGFLSIQTLGDGQYSSMALAYDFLYDFMRQKHYETSWYETVFEKITNTMTFRGYWNNNWFAAQTPAMVYAALSLENKEKRNYYLNFYLDKDTINGSCGHLALPSVVSKWLTPDGHWKEPGGYHNFPISSLLNSALAMENNGYNVFGNFPALLQSSYVLLKYSFPNFSAPSMGDTGPVSQSPEMLETGILMAKKYGNPIADNLIAAMNVMIREKGYKRESSDYMGLLCFLPEIPAQTGVGYTWPRSGELDFSKCYIQRNGTDREHGLMYLVQGASYNHNHANGMSIELYGAGKVMGVDPGHGLTYEAPMHVNYYAQWAAHNTVSAGGISSSVPFFKGGGGEKKMGEIKLAAMEPAAEKEAVSSWCSFTDTRYTDISTNTQQQRTLAIVRTSATTGYYIDIYRSANTTSNEYIYHNIGNDLVFLNADRKSLSVKPAVFPISQKPFDPPGFRNINDYKSTGKINTGLIALFSLKEKEDKYMQVLFTGEDGREFYSGNGPVSETADKPYREMPTPTLVSRQEGEAWKRPFTAIYEPFIGNNNYSVEKIETEDKSGAGDFTAIKVFNKDQSRQIILQSLQTDQLHQKNNWKFQGNFGIINIVKDQLNYLYLGDGNSIAYGGYGLEAKQPHSAANVIIERKNKLLVSCNQEIIITIKGSAGSAIHLTTAGQTKQLVAVRTKESISFSIPPVKNAIVEIK